MSGKDVREDINANQLLLEVSENPFSDKTEDVKNLLISNKELFSQNCLDQSLLSCCRKGNLLLLPAIISAGANLEVLDENGNTPLLVAAMYNNESCVIYLLGAGANVNIFNVEGNTALIVSVLNSASIGITKHLVGSQAITMDHVNKKGYTALLYAIETANYNAIKLLTDISGVDGVSHETIFKDNANKNIILSLIKLFQLQKATGKSALLHAALDRDIQSAQILKSMDRSIINASNDSFATIMIQFLESIKENNNVLNLPEFEMFEFILTQVTANSMSAREKEMIMDIVISIGECELVEKLMEFNFIISNENLSSAVSNPNFLKFLLTMRPVINKFNLQNEPVYDDSPLHIAIQRVEIESAKYLIQYGAFMDIDRILEDAVQWNQDKIVSFLLSEFPDQVGEKLKSPKMLYKAVINSASKIITILLDNGADINDKYKFKYCLTQALDINVLELLLMKGERFFGKIYLRPSMFPMHTFLSEEFESRLRKKWISLGNQDPSNTFLSNEIKGFVECLLRHGIDVDLHDTYGQTALHIAASKYHSVPIAKLLIDYGAGVDEIDYDGETPLRKAVSGENVEMVEFLISSGADINFIDTSRSTRKPVIFYAMNETILKILLDNGVNVKTIDGDSPLNSLLAKRKVGTDNVKRLIDAGCHVNHVNKDDDHVLILAAKYVDIQLFELLVKEGADVNASGRKFPYLTAVTAMLPKLWDDADRAISCIKYLIDHNANIDNVQSGVIHLLITSGCLTLIPRLIAGGLAPAYLKYRYVFNKPISPLMMALILNQSDLARYFISINYLSKSDIAVLYGNRELKILIERNSASNSKDLLKNTCRNPLSLETLCFVVISDTLGATQDRRSKVKKLDIPETLQNALLFKNVPESVIKDVGIRAYLYFNQTLEQLHL